jgi:hypothetical protein
MWDVDGRVAVGVGTCAQVVGVLGVARCKSW